MFNSFQENEGNSSTSRDNKRLTRRCDLVDLILAPLAAQIDQARLEILVKIQEVNDSADIIARQKSRELQEEQRKKQNQN